MDFKQIFDDDRAVSPVIGVILMVAITVILAAVIGTFVLGLGDQVQSTTPQASFGFETNNDTSISVTHETGDTIKAGDLSIAGAVSADFTDSGTGLSADDDVTAGTTVYVGDSDNGGHIGSSGFSYSDGDVIRVIYNNPDSDSSSTLGKFEYSA